MRRKWILIWLMLALAGTLQAQKSRVLAVIQLIETEKFKEAKESIELAVWNDRTADWSRTWYARGLLCQKAYEKGVEKKDNELTSLYPEQLLEAYDSYEKALDLNPGNRIITAIAKNYYALANDFQAEGKKHFGAREYSEALKDFEHALLITRSHLVSVKTDTSLIYNTAMAAYQAGNWEKAIGYLAGLNEDRYGPETAMLLYRAHLSHGDSTLAEKVLAESVDSYHSDEDLVLQYTNLLVSTGRPGEAVAVLDTAAIRYPGNALFPWTKGLILQQTGEYPEAILSLETARELAPERGGIYFALGICYYNMGVDLEEKARHISDNRSYLGQMEAARQNFMQAIEYLEKARELDPGHPGTNSRLNLLYQHLQLDRPG